MNVFFQQDGGTVHESNNSVTALRNIYGDWIISLHCGLLVNLIQRHVSVSGCFKDSIYENNARTEHGAYYRQLLDTKFKQFLLVCSPRVERVWELQEVVSNTCFNTQQVTVYSYNKAGCRFYEGDPR